MRSLKIVNKPGMMEIGALGDLRAWLGGQESVSLCTSRSQTNDWSLSKFIAEGVTRNSNRRVTQPSLSEELLLRCSMEGLYERTE